MAFDKKKFYEHSPKIGKDENGKAVAVKPKKEEQKAETGEHDTAMTDIMHKHSKERMDMHHKHEKEILEHMHSKGQQAMNEETTKTKVSKTDGKGE